MKRYTYKVLLCLIMFMSAGAFFRLSAQNSMLGDGFGGRLWYRPTANYVIGSYTGYCYCKDTLWAWGKNNDHQFGIPTSQLAGSNTPVAVPNINNIRFVTAGYSVAVIKNDSTCWAWGSKLSKSPVKYFDSVKFVNANALAVHAIKYDGSVWSVGWDRFGQFGYDTVVGNVFKTYLTPVKMKGISNAVRVAGTDGSTHVLLADSTVMSVGHNLCGKLGIDSTDYNSRRSTPLKVPGLKRIVDLRALQQSIIALDDSGYVYTWGSGVTGNMGDGQFKDGLKPQRVPGLKDIVAISAINDGYHFMALDVNKKLYLWGKNNMFYVGLFDSTKNDVGSPKLMATDVIDIMNGEMFDYIIKSDGSFWAIGSNMGPYMGWYITDRYITSIWMNLKDTGRFNFTQINPMIAPMKMCAPINPNILVRNQILASSQKCVGDSLVFKPSDTSSFKSYQWLFGDGVTDSGKKVNHTYHLPGKYKVRLVSYRESGFFKTDTSVLEVQIFDLPEIRIAVNDSVQCLEGNSFELRDTGRKEAGTVYTRNWYGPGGFAGKDSATIFEAGLAGKYSYKMTLRTSKGCRDSGYVRLYAVKNPDALIVVNDAIQCLNSQNFKFSATNQKHLIWTFGDGDSSILAQPDHEYKTPGTYKVILQVTDSNGCRNSDTASIVLADIKAQILSNKDTFCIESQNFNFKHASKASKTLWLFGDGDSSSSANTSHQYAQSGHYPVILKLNDTSGCSDIDTGLAVVLVNDVRLVADGPLIACIDAQKFEFSHKGIQQNAVWDFGDGNIASGTKVTHQYAASGHFKVTMVSQDLNHCVARDSAMVLVVNNSDKIRLAGEDSICLNNGVFRLSNSGNNKTLWQMGDGSTYQTDSVIHLYTRAGTYKVRFSSLDSHQCLSVDSLFLTVLPVPSVDFKLKRKECSNEVVLETDLSKLSSAKWIIDGQTFDKALRLYRFRDTGVFQFTLIGFIDRCSDTFTLTEVNHSMDSAMSFVPNVFTPGNDNFNDCFRFAVVNSLCEDDADIHVFDRWGVLVYKGKADGCWNGRLMNTGDELPSGTYYYMIRKPADPAGETKNGVIYLIR